MQAADPDGRINWMAMAESLIRIGLCNGGGNGSLIQRLKVKSGSLQLEV